MPELREVQGEALKKRTPPEWFILLYLAILIYGISMAIGAGL